MNEDAGRLQGLSVLLAEDEPGLQEAFTIILELEGCEVWRANDGKEALTLLSDEQPALIISDYMMPRMNGEELIHSIRARPECAGIPILLMSAALPKHVDRAIADLFLAKPVNMTLLLDAVHRLTRSRT